MVGEVFPSPSCGGAGGIAFELAGPSLNAGTCANRALLQSKEKGWRDLRVVCVWIPLVPYTASNPAAQGLCQSAAGSEKLTMKITWL